MAALFHIIIRILGLEIPVSLPRRPQVGETINLKVRGQRIPMVFDGTGFFHPRKVEGVTIPANAKPVIEQPEPVARSIPQWALDSDDPRIEYLVEQSEFNRDMFDAMLYASAWKDALLIKGDPAAEENELALRWCQLDAHRAKIARRSVSDPKKIKRAVKSPRIGKQDAAGEWLYLRGQDDPIVPEDAVIFAMDDVDREALSDLVSSDAEREDVWGVELPHVDWSMDVVSELLAHAGKIKAQRAAERKLEQAEKGLAALAKARGPFIDAAEWAREWLYANVHTLGTEREMVEGIWAMVAKADQFQAQIDAARQRVTMLRKQAMVDVDPSQVQHAPLATVLASLAVKRTMLTDKQLALVNGLFIPTGSVEWASETMMTVTHPKRGRVEIPVLHTYTRTNKLHNAAMALLPEIEDAVDEYEQRQAQWDEIAHPKKDTTPKVEVSPERQLSWLDWMANQKKKGDKPWLGRESYTSVLMHAFETQARTPTEAHNRAYNADSLRYPNNVVGYDGNEFIVKVNRAGEIKRVPAADARVAYPYLPIAAKQKLNSLAKAAKGIS